MKKIQLLAMVLSLFVGATSSEAVVITLGQQDFANFADVDVATYDAAQVGEPSRFDGFAGIDLGGAAMNFMASWTFNFGAGLVTDAVITLGLYEHDSAVPGSQVASFSVDGVDLTALLDAQLEAFGGRQQEGIFEASEYNVYSVILPAATFTDLADGMATFSLTLTGGGNSGHDIGPAAGNGAGLDFSSLSINEGRVPEPSTLVLLTIGGLSLFGFGAQRRST